MQRAVSIIRSRWVSLLLSLSLCAPIAFIAANTWFSLLGKSYSIGGLVLVVLILCVLFLGCVWFISEKFLSWLKNKQIKPSHRDYILLLIALIPIIAAVYSGWSKFAGKEVPNTTFVLSSAQEGSKLVSASLQLSQVEMFLWTVMITVGLFAIITVMGIIVLLLTDTSLHSRISGLVKLLENRPYISLVFLMLVIIFMFWPRGFITSPDAAYYLSLAKNLYHGNGYVNPDLSPNIYRGPVFPLLIASSYMLFGESFRSAIIMERIFWVLTILISYFLGKQLYNHRVGFLTASFILTAKVIDEGFNRVWTDGPLTFAILALQLMFWQACIRQRSSKWYALMGLAMGATYLLKQTVIFIAPLPFIAWIVFGEYRTPQMLKNILVFYFFFAIFYFGWAGYVYSVGGSAGQIMGTIKTGITFLSYISRGLPLTGPEQNHVLQEESTKTSVIGAFFELLNLFYTRDIQRFFKIAPLFPIALAFTLYQSVVKKNKADVFLTLGLLLYSPLIVIQAVVNFGYRQNLYFYCVVLLLIAAMLDRIFAKLSSKELSTAVLITVAFSLIFIQLSGGYYTFPRPLPVKDKETLDYLSNFQELANWVDSNVQPNMKIILPSRESIYLHILTAGNRNFETISTCMGEIGFLPAMKCTPPYISFWVYKGTTDPNEPRDFLQGISETLLLSTIREKGIDYVFVTPSIYSLYFYLKIHPGFEEIDNITNVAIFRVVGTVHPISSDPNINWVTCIGAGTSEYLINLKEADPVRYEMKLRDEIEPWMGLTRQDLDAFMNWQDCKFDVNFPGSYSLP